MAVIQETDGLCISEQRLAAHVGIVAPYIYLAIRQLV
jgi:hypothetical protein